MESKSQKRVSMIVFGIYLFLLTWLILFKFSVNFMELDHNRSINLIPFAASLNKREIIYNGLVFIPLGVYVNLFAQRWPILNKILPCLVLSFLYECIQYVFAIGASDITDLMLNTCGGIVGIVLSILFFRWFGGKAVRIINIIGIVVLTAAILMLGILTIANF